MNPNNYKKEPSLSKETETTKQLAILNKTLFEKTEDGFHLFEPIKNGAGKVIDYVTLAVNPAYEHNSGLKGEQVVGKRISEVLPNFEPMWFSVVQQVLQTGKAQHVEGFNMDTQRWYSQYIFKHREGQVCLL